MMLMMSLHVMSFHVISCHFMSFHVISCHVTILHNFFRSDFRCPIPTPSNSQPCQVLPQHRFARDSADASGGFRQLSMGIGPGLRLSEAQEILKNTSKDSSRLS